LHCCGTLSIEFDGAAPTQWLFGRYRTAATQATTTRHLVV
jgi:hypothetical protein